MTAPLDRTRIHSAFRALAEELRRDQKRGEILIELPLFEAVMSCYHDFMPKQTTVRLPDELADEAEAVARVQGSSVNQLIIDSLTAEIERVRSDEDFTSRAKRLIERDKELLERLGK